MKEKFWPLVFTQEDNEVTEGEVFAEHAPFFYQEP